MRLVGVVSVALVASTLVVTLLNLAAAKVDEVTVHDRQADASGRACERVTTMEGRDAPPHAFTCPLRLDVRALRTLGSPVAVTPSHRLGLIGVRGDPGGGSV